MAQNLSKSQKIDKSTEFKAKYNPCATIADEEIEELPDGSTNELEDYVKKFDDDNATFRSVFRSVPRH
jgi:hypothetical protein